MGISKKELYKKNNLVNIASYLEVNENKVMELHEDFMRTLEGEKFNHKEFIDYLIEYLEEYHYVGVEDSMPQCEYCQKESDSFIEDDSIYVCEECLSKIETFECDKCGLLFRTTEENFLICESCEAI